VGGMQECVEKRGPSSDHRARPSGELLQELRIILPGVQILFAFRLTVPF
jgi:hypothetical protein